MRKECSIGVKARGRARLSHPSFIIKLSPRNWKQVTRALATERKGFQASPRVCFPYVEYIMQNNHEGKETSLLLLPAGATQRECRSYRYILISSRFTAENDTISTHYGPVVLLPRSVASGIFMSYIFKISYFPRAVGRNILVLSI